MRDNGLLAFSVLFLHFTYHLIFGCVAQVLRLSLIEHVCPKFSGFTLFLQLPVYPLNGIVLTALMGSFVFASSVSRRLYDSAHILIPLVEGIK